jgi:predicted acylesterase/phospholipase RssA/CRP-like cAMP-binding protein
MIALAHDERRRLERELLEATLPRTFGPLDADTLAALEARVAWISLRRGEAPFRQGDAADGWYLVASGRLSVVVTDEAGVEKVLGEVGRGESLGEAALLTGAARTATPYALRDTVLLHFSQRHFEEILESHPRTVLSIARTLVRRSLGAAEPEKAASCLQIAVIAARPGIAVEPFARRLVEALGRLGRTLHVAPSRAAELGLPEPDARRLSTWLDERAAEHRFLVLEADPADTAWTRRALAEADHVLLVADARHAPAPHPLERALFGEARGPRHAQRTLVLLHPPGASLPRGTARWLDARDLQHHQHVRQDRPSDLDRLARTLAGLTVGLVLGAGGARGFAHVGTLRALAEARIPIDHVGGASIGALVGALAAMERTPEEIMDFGRRVAALRPFSELGLPITSLLRGRRVESIARLAFGDHDIEDLWIPFFCTSCDISRFRDVLHDRGALAPAVLASSALPGVLPPQVQGGRLLVDGGTTDMLPGEAMRARCKGTMIAVDVSVEREIEHAIDRYPTSWSALFHRLRPGAPKLPTLSEVFWRAVSFGVTRRTAEVARDADLFLRPPVERFGTVEIGAMNEIAAVGYAHARERLVGFRPPGI